MAATDDDHIESGWKLHHGMENSKAKRGRKAGVSRETAGLKRLFHVEHPQAIHRLPTACTQTIQSLFTAATKKPSCDGFKKIERRS
jgi:hypothetical protein